MTTTFPFAVVRKDRYEQEKAWGLSTQIDLYDCDPDLVRSRDDIEGFTHTLCRMPGVEMFGPTQIVRFGNHPEVYGYSMVQLIQTSLVSAHFAEEKTRTPSTWTSSAASTTTPPKPWTTPSVSSWPGTSACTPVFDGSLHASATPPAGIARTQRA